MHDIDLFARRAICDATHLRGGEQLEAFAAVIVEDVCDYHAGGHFGQYPEDQLHEIADSALPIYTHEIAQLVADTPELILHDAELIEAGSAEQAITAALYEVACAIARYTYNELQQDD